MLLLQRERLPHGGGKTMARALRCAAAATANTDANPDSSSKRHSSWLAEGPWKRSLPAGAMPALATEAVSAGQAGAETRRCCICWWTSTCT
ncbi:hypothetical protein CHLRE_01g011376v5 [Chlamydomonas reinhardtii]|uniref:Uncharacterized protein n=1 Tax=Chlamydomonas reinhardtii TaxID=3055 RepID=A0A2K3E5F9_CHLRE|nr:uncharacterized protein CHLRE_01g011376v5 [Chlamydomonas reinhardtii]PNW88029.1 hypothetical protein CHLRE_01g011376v5 [Chlamydomonas reinhardtii]